MGNSSLGNYETPGGKAPVRELSSRGTRGKERNDPHLQKKWSCRGRKQLALRLELAWKGRKAGMRIG